MPSERHSYLYCILLSSFVSTIIGSDKTGLPFLNTSSFTDLGIGGNLLSTVFGTLTKYFSAFLF